MSHYPSIFLHLCLFHVLCVKVSTRLPTRHSSPLGYTCSWQDFWTNDPSYVQGYLNGPPPANSCVFTCMCVCWYIHRNTKKDRWRQQIRLCVCVSVCVYMPTHDVYLLLYAGQQVFENCQLSHKILQLLVSTLIHRLKTTTHN